jgi:hypothetical protein
MADKAQLEILHKGDRAWNAWRMRNPHTKPQLSGAKLSRANLTWANLCEANLARADLSRAELSEATLIEADFRAADLSGADLTLACLVEADLSGANLSGAKLNGANLIRAKLGGANLSAANLSRTDLTGAHLEGSSLVRANLCGAALDGCHVYGISVWDITCDGAIQSNLIITPPGQAMIQVDNLEVAQFIYLILNNQKIREVIDTITSKVVLILGNFSPRRKIVLDAVREELRQRGYLLVLFDFEGPQRRDLTETISTLAHLARFVIADVTEPRSVPAELAVIVPHLSVPVQTLLLASERPYALLDDLSKYPWFLPPFRYKDQEHLIASLGEKVVGAAEKKVIQQKPKT